ncbi:unnamed protein product [Parascedosporium putredinis]|uniref:2,4-dienoyl-CoA reductase [(3E)-enoyl-CoA-producing] n=1 Tax=Parascedosporium putredinis TaxID=1442378 RepID=A0A9P1M8T9_9PEZI|nr:unnamed protein product [Parascedosporium putredinis]CAI7989549.1 unnamed protein product [Parascedosporium putredinis]
MTDAEVFSHRTWAPNIFGKDRNPPPTIHPLAVPSVLTASRTIQPTAGKVVFCTGGAGTICSGQVKALVKLGADAAIISRKADVAVAKASEIAALRPGSKVLGLQGDVRSVESMKAAADETVRQLGKIDFLICGAAGNFLSSFDDLSANAFKTVIDIDLLGSFNATKACADQLKKNKGRIIYVSATLHYIGTPLQTHAASAKAGVDTLSSQMCIEYGPWGVNSNVSHRPGATAATEGLSRLSNQEGLNEGVRNIPLQRFGLVSEIADATIFLFSPAANYISGAVIPVDGGYYHINGQMHSVRYPDNVMRQGPSKI